MLQRKAYIIVFFVCFLAAFNDAQITVHDAGAFLENLIDSYVKITPLRICVKWLNELKKILFVL